MSSNHVVAVFVPRQQEADRLARRLRAEGADVLRIASSDELHRALSALRIDALVIEQQLHGFLTGLEILGRLRDQLLRPVTVLLGELTGAERQRASQLCVDFVSSWSEGVDAIGGSLMMALRSATRTALNIPAAARERVARADYIRPMPQLVVQVMRYLHDENASVAELARDITADARMTAELLRLINSAAFGLQSRVEKVADAVAFLGMRQTAALILATAVHQFRGGWNNMLPAELTRWFALRSVVTASVASSFAKHLSGVSADTAYVLALLQDLGILVLAHDVGENYWRLLQRVRSVAQLQLHACEQQEFSFTHADVSAALMQKWDLPASLIRLVLNHHARREEHSSTDGKFLHLSRLGEAVANMRDVPSPQRHRHFQRLLAEYNETRHVDVKACFVAAMDKAAQATKLFDVPVPDAREWGLLLQQLISELKHPSAGADSIPPTEDGAAAADDQSPRVDYPPAAHADDPAGGESPRRDDPCVSCTEPPAEPLQSHPAGSASPEWRCPPSGAQPQDPDALTPTLLVIDDEPSIGRVIRLFLKGAPLAVDFQTRPPSVADVGPHVVGVLCDVHLGQGSGIEFVRRLRDSGFTRPVLMISGDRTRQTVVDSVEAGIDDYLLKPFNRQALLAKLTRHRLLPAEESNQTQESRNPPIGALS